MRPSKKPSKIYKVPFTFDNLQGKVWLDRWGENTWFECNGKVYPPIIVEQWIIFLPFQVKLNLMFKLIYSEHIKNLLSDFNPFLALRPKITGLFSASVPIPLIYGAGRE